MSDSENETNSNKPGNPNLQNPDYARTMGQLGGATRWFKEEQAKQAEQTASTESAASFIKSFFSK